jgi:hypothetical protein
MALGRDSAQTELLLAFLLVEQKRDDEAQAFLTMAAGIIAETNVPSDCALYARVSGLLAARQAQAKGDCVLPALNQLQEAIRLFAAAGYHSAAKEVTREVETLKAQA